MKKAYKPHNPAEAMGHIVEECGEVLAAIGKSQRFGLFSVNPELAPAKQEDNYTWLNRELKDLKKAIKRYQKLMKKELDQ